MAPSQGPGPIRCIYLLTIVNHTLWKKKKVKKVKENAEYGVSIDYYPKNLVNSNYKLNSYLYSKHSGLNTNNFPSWMKRMKKPRQSDDDDDEKEKNSKS